MQEIPSEFEIENKYGNNFGAKKRKFRLVKMYDNFALYECYKKRQNKDEHLFYECFSRSFLCSL